MVSVGGKKCSLIGYVGKLTVNTRLGEVKLVGKAASQESVPYSGSWDEAVQVITKRNREKKYHLCSWKISI